MPEQPNPSEGEHDTGATLSRQPQPFVMLPKACIRELTPRSLQLYAALAAYADNEGRCFPGQARLATDLSISERTVRDALAELEASGWLQVERRRTTGGHYRGNRYLLMGQRQQAASGGRQRTAGHGRQEPAAELDTLLTRKTNPADAGLAAPSPRPGNPPLETSGQLALPGAEKPPAARSPQQAAVAAWVEGWQSMSSDPPTSRARGQVAREAAQLLGDGYPPERVEQLARQAGGKGWASLVREAEATAREARPTPARGSWEARTAGLAEWIEQEERR